MNEFIFIIVISVIVTVLEPVLRPVRRNVSALYAPPRGRWVLAATWLGVVGTLLIAWTPSRLSDSIRVVLLIGAPMLALVASFVTRDRYRVAAGYGPIPPSFSGAFSRSARMLLAGLGLVSLTAAAFLAFGDLHDLSLDALKLAILGTVLVGAAVTGSTGKRFATWLNRPFGDGANPSDPVA